MRTSLLRSRKAKAFAGLLFLAVAGPMCGSGGGGGGAPPGGGATFSVVAHTPISNQLNVVRTSTIFLTVNGDVDQATLTVGSITLFGNPNLIPVTLSKNPATLQIEVKPTTPLQIGAPHTLNVTATVKTLSGASMVPTSFNFTAANSADTGLPVFGGVTSLTVPTKNSMTVGWTQGTDPAGSPQAALVYDVYLATTAGGHNFSNPPVVTSSAGSASVPLTLLTSNTTYFIVVRCRDQAGNTDANTTALSLKTYVSFSTDIYTPIISTRCITCHVVGGLSEFMDLSLGASDVVVNKWVGIPADPGSMSTQACQASGLTRVVAGQPLNSLVYLKIIPNPQPCGVRMPEDGATTGYLTSGQIQLFLDWITEGASNN